MQWSSGSGSSLKEPDSIDRLGMGMLMLGHERKKRKVSKSILVWIKRTHFTHSRHYVCMWRSHKNPLSLSSPQLFNFNINETHLND
jgi:hypothetical protein